MIFDEIVLYNFGVYLGRQSLQLAPPVPDKPITLVGGLNGGGKTTLLDAIHLALYGKRARLSNRGSLAYEDYLSRSINRHIPSSEGASLELQFRHRAEGIEHTYRICRTWTANGKGASEQVEVIRDGSFDRVLTDVWAELIEDFIPARLSPLFFFDGEKIENFANTSNSAQLLSTAIHSLLGLDIVDRLTSDLTVLQTRKLTSLSQDVERQHIETLQAEVKETEAKHAELVEVRAAQQNIVDRLRKHLREAEMRFSTQGGDLFARQAELMKERRELQSKLAEVEREARELAADAAPLLLLSDFINDIEEQDEGEQTAAQAALIESILAERDERIVARIKSDVNSETTASLKDFLAEDRRQWTARNDVQVYLSLDTEGRKTLRRLRAEVLPQTQEHVNRVTEQIRALQQQIEDVERKLAAVPDESSIKPLIEAREETRNALVAKEARLAAIDEDLIRVAREQEQKRRAWQAQAEQALEHQFAAEDTKRIVTHAKRVQETLNGFRTSVVARHVARIERLILDGFRQLLRKKSLISDLKIHPQHFALELCDADGKTLSPERLSAGERQLLAVAILWGLARASGRPLPTVIDTPLGRLDASHRVNLVEHYFPYASHQVLLFSTDEEINENYYEQIKPFVGRSYTLVFDDALGSTQVEPGYFQER